MRTVNKLSAIILCLAAALCAAYPAAAQKSPVASRVVEAVDETRTTRTPGNVHPLARAEFDRGAVAASQPMTRMLVLLQRSPEQETALQQLMDAQQTKGSTSYHTWMTPEQFGAQFGPSDADVQAVTDWLTRQGFQIAKVSAGRTTIEFSGTVAQVRSAFQTEIHKYSANGTEFIANTSDPSIPAALAPVVRGIVALHNFPKQSHVRNNGQYLRINATGELKPLFTFGNPANYALAPDDFNIIYNVKPAGMDGSGQKIAIVGQSNINTQDICDFRALFALTPSCPAYVADLNNGPLQIKLNGPDPGILGPSSTNDEGESDLDVEWAGAIAPKATIIFVATQSTSTNPAQITAGIDLSALYIVDNNLAPVLSESYGSCEESNLTSGNQFYNQLWEQAAAQGITVVISSGDNGSAGCDNSNVETAATLGLAVSGISSTPFNVSVGGTDFNPTAVPVTPPNQYWSATNGATQGSAIKYIPETPWNASTCATNYPTVCGSVNASGGDLTAGSGGPSNCTVSNGTSCSGGYTKPPFQTGAAFGSVLTAATTRVQPDISFFASNGINGVSYIVCQADSVPQNGASCALGTPFTDFGLVGGTSGPTPAFAAIIALVNQKTGQRQGNANYVLYGLAALDPNYANGSCNSATPPLSTCVFNDVVQAQNASGVQWNNSVACVAGKPNCSNTGSGFGVLISGSSAAYVAGQGYDFATGLGSINVTNLLNKWSTFSRSATTTALSAASGGTPSGQNFSVKVTITPSSATGDVSLIATTSSGATSGFGPFTLSGGTVTAQTNLLPPGTTSIVANYAGDATHAASFGSIAYTVSGTAGTTTAQTQIYYTSFSSTGVPSTPTTSSQNIPYGSPYVLQIAVTNKANGATCGFNYPTTKPTFPCPTGTITLTDNGTPLNDFPNAGTPNATNVAKLNNFGIAEDQPIQLSATIGTTTPGVHKLVATYSGDLNYAAGPGSNTLQITITKGATATGVLSQGSGNTFSFQATIATQSNGDGPTGTVTFSNGGTSIGTAACTAGSTAVSGGSNSTGFNGTTIGTGYCVVQLTNVNIASLYPPPTNQPKLPIGPFVLLALALSLALALTQWMPENRRRAYAYASLIAFALLATAIAGCGGGSGGGGGGGGKTRTISVVYPGDSNYATSTGSTTVTIP